MKSFRLLTQQIDQWWQMCLLGVLRKRLNQILRRAVDWRRRWLEAVQKQEFWQDLFQLRSDRLVQAVQRRRLLRRRSHTTLNFSRSIVLVFSVIFLTSAIGYRFYNEPQLGVDTIAPQTLRAPASATVEDAKTTEENRKAARIGSIPVLMIDQTVNQEIYQSLQRVLDEGNDFREQAGALPFVETSILSTPAQQHLRQAADEEWQAAIAAVEEDTNKSSSVSRSGQNSRTAISVSSAQRLAMIELKNYRRIASTEDFSALKQVISLARQRYAKAFNALLALSADEPSSVYTPDLFNLTDSEWLETKIVTRQALERILIQGIPPGLPDALLENAIKTQVAIDVPPAGTTVATQILVAVSQPNLVQDPEQTRILAEQAAQAVKPEMVEIRQGDVIIQAGKPITQSNFVLLDYFRLSRRGINWLGLSGFAVVISGSIAIFLKVERRFHPGLRRRDHLLMGLLTLSTPLVVALGIAATSLPLVGLLVGSFYGSALGLTVVALLAIALPMGMEISWNHLIASTISSLLGAMMAGRLRSREELALLGGAVGLTQGVIYLLLSLILNTPTSPVWYGVLSAAVLQGLLGVAWSVVALGISPYLEHLFDLVTPIRLAELSNPNRPLLKRLASEAPGTFQHTLFVSTLAEAAAHSLGCNVELVRAGTLYHDIGKMHDPLSFIENQMGGPNKHDAIANPWKSAQIIKKHVSEGLVMARKYRLPKAIQAFIPEHQGTMLIAYFHHEAQQRAQADPNLIIDEADFRYDGPIPQTRETGIVMLADACEAALRSLRDATPEEALAMINRIFRARWQDNQMLDSGLTRSEMSCAAEIFVRVWQQFNHQRIPYPKLASSPQPPSALK